MEPDPVVQPRWSRGCCEEGVCIAKPPSQKASAGGCAPCQMAGWAGHMANIGIAVTGESEDAAQSESWRYTNCTVDATCARCLQQRHLAERL